MLVQAKPFELELTTRTLPVPATQDVQPLSFGRYPNFNTDDAVESFTYESPDIKATTVRKKQLAENANRLYTEALKDPGLWYITSSFDSIRANLYMANVLRVCRTIYIHGKHSKRRSYYGHPEFVWLTGSYRMLDKFLQSKNESMWPIVLGLAGFDANSSDMKRENLRDIINAASNHDITVLVAASGCNPLQLQYDKLHIAPSGVIHFGFEDLSKSVAI